MVKVFIHLLKFIRLRNDSVVIFLGKNRHTIDKIPKNPYQFRVVFGLKIFPSKIIILCLWRRRKQCVAQCILLVREILYIFVSPYSPVSRSRNFIIFKVKEFKCRDIFRHDVVSVSFHHRWENDAVEDNVVLPNEVNKVCFFILPKIFPVFAVFLCPFLRERNITDRRIKPNIKHLALCVWKWNRNAPV